MLNERVRIDAGLDDEVEVAYKASGVRCIETRRNRPSVAGTPQISCCKCWRLSIEKPSKYFPVQSKSHSRIWREKIGKNTDEQRATGARPEKTKIGQQEDPEMQPTNVPISLR